MRRTMFAAGGRLNGRQFLRTSEQCSTNTERVRGPRLSPVRSPGAVQQPEGAVRLRGPFAKVGGCSNPNNCSPDSVEVREGAMPSLWGQPLAVESTPQTVCDCERGESPRGGPARPKTQGRMSPGHNSPAQAAPQPEQVEGLHFRSRRFASSNSAIGCGETPQQGPFSPSATARPRFKSAGLQPFRETRPLWPVCPSARRAAGAVCSHLFTTEDDR